MNSGEDEAADTAEERLAIRESESVDDGKDIIGGDELPKIRER